VAEQLDYIRVNYPEPHAARGRQMLAAHPELRTLAGPMPISAALVVVLVAAQFAVALAVADRGWIVWLLSAYLVGATIDHALWVLIHECAHNLIFRSRTLNRVVAIVANLPMVLPAALSFCKYHLLHHRHIGELEFDAGVPGPTESHVVGRSAVLKTIWVAAFAIVMGVIRPLRMKRIPFIDRWTVVNIVVQAVAMAALVMWAGVGPFKYLAASTVLAIGLHPLGARWIQEHFAFAPGQETYSYYGPLNKVSFNVGYHNEHHDLMTIAWARLPEIRRTAPEFYDGLKSYQSWTALLVRFLRDRHITLFHYIVRPAREERTADPV